MKVEPEKLLKDILESGEEIVQIEVKVRHAQHLELLREVKKLHNLMRKHGVKAVQAF